MMVRNFVVSLSPADAAKIIIEAITREKQRFLIDTRAGVLIDDHRVECSLGQVILLIFTKYYARVTSYVTLVVIISNLSGQTTIRASIGGHKSFDGETDLGASESFLKKVKRAVNGYEKG